MLELTWLFMRWAAFIAWFYFRCSRIGLFECLLPVSAVPQEFEGRLVVIPPQRLRQPRRYGAGGLRDRLQYLRPAGQLPAGPGAHADAGAR